MANKDMTNDKTVVTGPVLIGGEIDRQGDIIPIKEIKKAAHDYMNGKDINSNPFQVDKGIVDAMIERMDNRFCFREEEKVRGPEPSYREDIIASVIVLALCYLFYKGCEQLHIYI